jgi:hypothetical protein
VNEKCHGISSHLERKKGKQKRQAHSVQAVGVQQARAQAAPVPSLLVLGWSEVTSSPLLVNTLGPGSSNPGSRAHRLLPWKWVCLACHLPFPAVNVGIIHSPPSLEQKPSSVEPPLQCVSLMCYLLLSRAKEATDTRSHVCVTRPQVT